MFLILLAVLVSLTVYWVHQKTSQKTTEPPMLPGRWPILGHAPLVFGSTIDLWKTSYNVSFKVHELGGVAAATFGSRTVYLVCDPDDYFTVANTCLKKDSIYNFAKPWLGEGLVTAKVPTWKRHRKLINPAFNQAILDGFLEYFNKQARKLVQDFSGQVGKGEFDHYVLIRNNNLETICMTALGIDYNDKLLSEEYVEAVEENFKIMADRLTKLWPIHPLAFKWSGLKKRQDDCVKILHHMSNTVLGRKKTDMANGNHTKIPEEKNMTNSGRKGKVFIDILMDLAKEEGAFTEQEIREEVDTMIMAGHDTTAIVLLFTMLCLGAHPEAQDKVYNEILDIFGDSDGDIEKQDLSALVYLEAVLKESMRLYTIGPVFARWVDRDVKLKNCTLSAGRTCLVFVVGMHRLPMWGPDANQFVPERWIEPNRLPDNPYVFGAFLGGRRMCLGKNYAYMSMKTTLVHILRQFRIIADDSKLVLKMDPMLKPDSGYFISVEKRTATK